MIRRLVDYLIDTNILVRWANAADPQRPVVLNALAILIGRGDDLKVAAQNMIEFWVTATRPVANNGLGLSPAQAQPLVGTLTTLFQLIADTPAVFPEWLTLVTSLGVSGKQSHDARLAAVMLVANITHILTFNTGDFVRYGSRGILPIDPATVQ